MDRPAMQIDAGFAFKRCPCRFEDRISILHIGHLQIQHSTLDQPAPIRHELMEIEIIGMRPQIELLGTPILLEDLS
jgi:hypothetical protein